MDFTAIYKASARADILRLARHCDALAGTLVELVRDSALRQWLAANVRAMNFGDESWQTIAKQTMEVYRRVLAPAD